ncbi:PREDICTED: uncharacterized protein LOC109164580 [Ipomoea nil]|uniref:uncharacterized protein LOC109164580 n=1 Tax=Ipomoea nil TaxID=35883 RepID=UPI000900F3DC|nr:PREDICTED: uncharacterized protein LOC109164580 [Ipomoea nil]
MGSCLSSTKGHTVMEKHNSANVISSTGELRQFSIPVKVSQVLFSESTTTTTTSALDHASFFMCNSDRLYFDDYIPPMDQEDELEAGQIYFLLPTNKLQYRLSASDMAALAVKASLALQTINRRRRSRSKRISTSKSRISPVIFQQSDHGQLQQYDSHSGETIISKGATSSSSGLGVPMSSRPARKLKRYSSQRAKMAVRSFRLRLTTIQEGSVLGPFY